MNEAYLASEIMKAAADMKWYTNALEIPVGDRTVMITTQLDSPMIAEVSWHLRVVNHHYEAVKSWFAPTPTDLLICSASIARFLNIGEELPTQVLLALPAPP